MVSVRDLQNRLEWPSVQPPSSFESLGETAKRDSALGALLNLAETPGTYWGGSVEVGGT
jgi:hypothetical protein